MISGRLHPSERADQILDELRQELDVEKLVLARLAFTASLREKGAYEFTDEQYDHQGKEFRLQTFEQSQKGIVRNLLCLTYRRALADDEWTELLLKHINKGTAILEALFRQSHEQTDEFFLALESKFGCEIPKRPSSEDFLPQDTLRILVGYVEGDKTKPFIWAMNDSRIYPNAHTAIMGDPGTGKTALLVKILADIRRQSNESINLFVIDYKGDIAEPSRRPRLRDVTDITVIDPYERPLPINPFVLNAYTENDVRFSAQQKAEMFEAFCKKGGAVQRGIFRDAVIAAYERRRNTQPPYPDFEEVYREMQQITQKRDSLSEMMEMIATSKLFHFHSSGEQPFGRLSEVSCIVRLDRIPAYKEVIAFLILERLYREMVSLPDSPIDEETGNRQIRTCVIIDEAHHYLGRNNEFLDKLIREGRSKGFVVILCSQSPRDYRQKFDYGQFIENKFIFKCQVNKGELQYLIKSDDATAARMVEDVMNLPKGHCLFNHPISSKQSFTRLKASQFHEVIQ